MAATMSAPPPLPRRDNRPPPPSAKTLPRSRPPPTSVSTSARGSHTLDRQRVPYYSSGYDDSSPPPPPPTRTLPHRRPRPPTPEDDLPPPPQEWQFTERRPSDVPYNHNSEFYLHSKGVSAPNLQALDDVPPVPPRRGATVHNAHGKSTPVSSNKHERSNANLYDFEKRFFFHKPSEFPPPLEFSGKPKKYASTSSEYQSSGHRR